MTIVYKDVLWKAIIEDLFDDFVRFFYEYEDYEFDLARGVEFMDKELGQVGMGEESAHPWEVDKLVKVYRRNPAYNPVLMHIEVQGYRDRLFANRMFTYFYRLTDRYGKQVWSMVIFTDGDRSFKPGEYVYAGGETSVLFKYKSYKILDQDVAVLSESDNPFAFVVLIALVMIGAKNRDSEGLLQQGISVVKQILEKRFPLRIVQSLLNFFMGHFIFDREICDKFGGRVRNLMGQNFNSMGIEETVKMLQRHIGKQEGIEIGLARGMEEGIEKGEERARASFVARLLLHGEFSVDEIVALADCSREFVLKIKESLPKASE